MPEREITERVSSLEANVAAIKGQINDLQATITTGLANINVRMDRDGKTDWQTIIIGIGLIITCWAAAVRPINADVERQDKNAAVLADAVKVQDLILTSLKVADESQRKDIVQLQDLAKVYNATGSPAADRRLTVVEWRLDHATGVSCPPPPGMERKP